MSVLLRRPRSEWVTKKGKGLCARWLREHVNYDGEVCLIWPFSRIPNGYGNFGLDGKVLYAHRYMCELINGPPPTPTHEAAHSCGRGHDGCVHPKHLAWKTISENLLDRRRHGTVPRRDGPKRKLTDDQVREIRSLRGTMRQDQIAERYGVSPPTIRDIFHGRSRTRVA